MENESYAMKGEEGPHSYAHNSHSASDIILDSEVDPRGTFELLGACLVDMMKVGLVGEKKIDSFNVPIFFSHVKNVKAIFETFDCFGIEWIEGLDSNDISVIPNAQTFVSTCRAMQEELIEKHFGGGIVDELFDRFTKKVEEFPNFWNLEKIKAVTLYVLMKRKSKA